MNDYIISLVYYAVLISSGVFLFVGFDYGYPTFIGGLIIMIYGLFFVFTCMEIITTKNAIR